MRDYAKVKSHLLWDLEPWLKADTMYLSDMSVPNALARALADSFYKKLCPLGNTKEADEAALKKFKTINSGISNEPFGFAADNEAESCFWDYFKHNLNRSLGFEVEGENYDLAFITKSMDVGPGAAQLSNSESFMTKLFEGDLSYTDDSLIPLYRSALAETGLWAEAEMLRSVQFRFRKVEGGKLFFTPKNSEISRTCCTEANLNMLIQKSAGAFIEERLLRYFGISLSTQPDHNRRFARIGSVDGSFGTIDLVSASDSISWQLMLASLDDSFFKAVLRISRSESAVLPDGSEVALRMISTMGNGFTFPLQTIIFASAVRSVYQLMGFPCVCPVSQYGVFGDDIVVRREAYDFTVRMLTKLGFEVNAGKSFNSGPFRESCGHDYFRGNNIRGVYVKSLETPQEVYSCINRLVRWSTSSGIPLIRTLNLLRSWVRFIPVPPHESDDAGFKVPMKATVPRVTASYWYHYRYYKAKTRQRSIPEPDLTPNPHGYGLGFLGGYARRPERPLTIAYSDRPLKGPSDAAVVSFRDDPGRKLRYQIVDSATPWWDWPGNGPPLQDTWNLRAAGDRGSHSLWEKTVMATFNFR